MADQEHDHEHEESDSGWLERIVDSLWVLYVVVAVVLLTMWLFRLI